MKIVTFSPEQKGRENVRKKIHPKYDIATITCACGNSFVTRSTNTEQNLEICSACHPFFTGKQKFIDSAGRVEKYMQRYGKKTEQETPEKK